MTATIAAESALDMLLDEDWFMEPGRVIIERNDFGGITVWTEHNEAYRITSEGGITRVFTRGFERVIL